MQPCGYVEEAVCTAYSKFFALAIIFGLSRAIGFLLTDVQTTSVYSKSDTASTYAKQ
ncbi:MAG: hypothetical protein K940chlam7_01395 [Chlamydiae bacterium]|nr:hypothetical protein [Chlamydiota bacterium]